MTTLDLSDNNLSGQIPEQITSLLGLWNLNLSGNHLTGEITHKFSQLIELESLDLSRNQLSGSIPPALSNLTFLSHFNVSYNNLTGSIPSGNQLNTFTDPSAFMGNPFLCGFPLNNSCDKVVTDEPAYKNEIKTHNHDAIWLYISAVLGFVLGFWVVWGVLLFSEASRHSYFRVVDDFFDRVYVSVVLNFRLIKRKAKRKEVITLSDSVVVEAKAKQLVSSLAEPRFVARLGCKSPLKSQKTDYDKHMVHSFQDIQEDRKQQMEL
ncbi:receptor-like protein EIX2 [Zingiber officinale]|uniref:receptor-like protein EIX2 n=1 Tax=Zingiber officinale TaxID=94328 RepID=UPI001C4A9DF1|nr:receptor-like protein EIX2 [Zingiber officinale]